MWHLKNGIQKGSASSLIQEDQFKAQNTNTILKKPPEDNKNLLRNLDKSVSYQRDAFHQ